jgi:hypothetical protein
LTIVNVAKHVAAQRIALTRRKDWKRGEMELMSMASLVVGLGKQTIGESAGLGWLKRSSDHQLLNKISETTLGSQVP